MQLDQNDLKNSNRIVIWEPPSSGKSTLANSLANYLQIESVIFTDDYLTYNHNKKWEFMEMTKFLNKINPILNGETWVVEGNLGEIVSRSYIMEIADWVIILNPSFLRLFSRIIRRGLYRSYGIKIGYQSRENATILGKYSIIDVMKEIKASIFTVLSFKQGFLNYLIDLAKKSGNITKITVVS